PKADIWRRQVDVRLCAISRHTGRFWILLMLGGRVITSWSITRETSPQTISASFSGRCCIASAVTHRIGAGLSNPTGALDRRISAGRPERHHRAPYGRPIISALAPAVCRREPAGRVEQCRNGDGREVSGRRLYDYGTGYRQFNQRIALR